MNLLKIIATLPRKSFPGQTLLEYALLIALISFAVIAALYLLGPALGNFFNGLTTMVNTTL